VAVMMHRCWLRAWALPKTHPRRAGILRALASWKVIMEAKEILDALEQEELMALCFSGLGAKDD
jgi:tryptophan synthase beta subunit